MTSQQVALYEMAATYLSPRVHAPDFSQRLAAHIGQALRADASFGAPEIRIVPRGEVLSSLPEFGFFSIVGAQPTPHKLIVDIDASLGLWAVERLLAGEANVASAHVLRPPTDLELGVLTYLLVDVLQMLIGELNGGRELALSLDRLVGSAHALHEAVGGGDEELVEYGVRLQLERRLGYVRILLPSSLMSGFFGARIPDVAQTPAELDNMRRCLQALPERDHELRVVGAHIQLSKDDIANVEAGDIIVLEQHQLKWTPDATTGRVTIRIGDGNNGGIEARLYDELGESRLEVTDIIVQHHVETPAMAEPEAPEGQDAPDNLPQTESLLRDIDSSVAIELGRLKLNTAQIVRLRKGQVLRLARTANEPVDLVVGGKLFAKGELLEVDGELGVRLTHVTGTHP